MKLEIETKGAPGGALNWRDWRVFHNHKPS